jgi:hypothetical protein
VTVNSIVGARSVDTSMGLLTLLLALAGALLLSGSV